MENRKDEEDEHRKAVDLWVTNHWAGLVTMKTVNMLSLEFILPEYKPIAAFLGNILLWFHVNESFLCIYQNCLLTHIYIIYIKARSI